jgi:EAL domain-containing protein (putative c-di-GMP-specific phosphodiesterase class I)
VSAMRRVAGLLGDHAGPIRLGAACAPDHTFKAVKLLRFAELALERATGRGETALLYNPRHHAPQPASDKAPFDLVGALNDRRLTLACQKVVDAQSRAPALTQTYAALPGSKGNLIPLWALPALDEANLALLVDVRMLELGADHLAGDPQARLALPVSIRTLQDPEWLPTLAAHLGARPGIESRLLVEVPEAALAEGGAGWGRLNAMKALGIGLILTGFGTGHVRLDQLKNLPFDLLKIDGVFTQTLKRSTDDRLYVRTLVDKAQHLGIATLAEWVDDEHTARLLASWGVDYLQGALFGEPEPLRRPLTLQQMLKAARA